MVVNGELSPSNGDKLLQEVCKAYKGEKPEGCASVLREEKRVCLNDAVEEA